MNPTRPCLLDKTPFSPVWAGWVPLVLAIHRVADQEKANGTCSSLILSL